MWLLAVECSSVGLVRLRYISLLRLLLVLSLTASSSQDYVQLHPTVLLSAKIQDTVRKAKFEGGRAPPIDQF